MPTFPSSRALAAAALGLIASATPQARAQDSTFHQTYLIVDNILIFNGTMTVPPRVADGGTPYLWPGLQPRGDSTVLQPVLDGRGQHWYWGNALVGNPGGPYGGGQSVSPGEKLSFSMVNKDGNGNWRISSGNGAGTLVNYDYDVAVQMNRALFVSEIYSDAVWNFGDLVFSDVIVTAPGTDSSWCSSDRLRAVQQSVNLSVGSVSATVQGNAVYCAVQSLTLSAP
ncbi:unnamed protein product [Jaminaea pallidilutea]